MQHVGPITDVLRGISSRACQPRVSGSGVRRADEKAIATLRLHGLDDQPALAHAEPDTLRYRLLHLPAKLATPRNSPPTPAEDLCPPRHLARGRRVPALLATPRPAPQRHAAPPTDRNSQFHTDLDQCPSRVMGGCSTCDMTATSGSPKDLARGMWLLYGYRGNSY